MNVTDRLADNGVVMNKSDNAVKGNTQNKGIN